MTRTDNPDGILVRLFDRRKRSVQVALLWLLIAIGLASILFCLACLLKQAVVESARPPNFSASQTAAGSEAPLWSDAFVAVTICSLAAAWISGIAMQLFDDQKVRYVASVVVCGCATILLIACVLCFANGAGDVSAAGASGEDYFVVYLAPFALATAIGSAIGGAIAVTR